MNKIGDKTDFYIKMASGKWIFSAIIPHSSEYKIKNYGFVNTAFDKFGICYVVSRKVGYDTEYTVYFVDQESLTKFVMSN